MTVSYRTTLVFDEKSLPAALQACHTTKAGVWGVVRVFEGRLRLTYLDPPSEVIVDAENPGLLLPEQPHFVTVLGPVQMRVEFYDQSPQG